MAAGSHLLDAVLDADDYAQIGVLNDLAARMLAALLLSESRALRAERDALRAERDALRAEREKTQGTTDARPAVHPWAPPRPGPWLPRQRTGGRPVLVDATGHED